MRIDVHAHYFPTEYVDLLDRLGGPTSETALRLPSGRMGLDEERRGLDAAGIQAGCLGCSEGRLLP